MVILIAVVLRNLIFQNLQYFTHVTPYEDDGKHLMMLLTHLVLIQEESFKKYIHIYVADQAKFFDNLSRVFSKL